MAVLPDKILEDAEINAFIDRVNVSASEIISDSKFKIPNSNLFGLGLLVKLEIRTLEKSLASSFAPIFMGKKVLSGGLSGIKSTVQSIKTLFTNPLQFILDEGINNQLKDFPFPVSLNLQNLGGNIAKLKELINSSSPDGVESGVEKYNYKLGYTNSGAPKSGEILTTSGSIESITLIRVNPVTDNGSENDSIRLLEPGDYFELSSNGKIGAFEVSYINVAGGENRYYEIGLKLNSVSGEDYAPGEKVTIPGFINSQLGILRRISLRDFIKDGKLSIPFSVLGLNLPLISGVNLVIGDFSKVSSDSPTKKYLDQLSSLSGSSYNQILSDIFTGKFPKIDFKKLQETIASGNPDVKEKSTEDLVSFARMIQIGSENPFFLIKILLNYLKLLLLPIQLVVGVLKGLAEKITNPVSLIRTVIKGLSNPLGLICDLISEAFLQFLEPYISPVISPIMSYQEAKVSPDDPSRGLQPLISDMVCGGFKRGLRDYVPNKAFFDSLRGKLGPDQDLSGVPITFPYAFRGQLESPDKGEITANSESLDSITVIRVSLISGDVENATGPLVNVTPGDSIRLSVEESYSNFRVSYKKVEDSYIEYGVSKEKSASDFEDLSDIEKILKGINKDQFLAYLTVDNPNKVMLYIIEKYLPIKLIAVWESLKGIIAIFGGLAMEIPSLFPAIIRSLFGLNAGTSIEERVAAIKSGEESPNSTIDAINETLSLLVTNKEKSLVYEGTSKNSSSGNYSEEARSAWYSLVYDIDGDQPIETFFYDLYDQLKSLEMDTAVYRDKLSSKVFGGGKDRYYNREKSDDKWVFNPSDPEKMPGKGDFYYGAYSVNDIGKSVKVLLSVLYFYRGKKYYGSENVNLEDSTITIPTVDSTGKEINLYTGSVRDAIRRYKVTNQAIDNKPRVDDLRRMLVREIWFIQNRLMPSLKK